MTRLDPMLRRMCKVTQGRTGIHHGSSHSCVCPVHKLGTLFNYITAIVYYSVPLIYLYYTIQKMNNFYENRKRRGRKETADDGDES